MAKLARTFDLFDPIRKRLVDGMPALGTCAGMILLADRILDGIVGQETFGGLDVTVRRNAFGRQVASAEIPLAIPALGPKPFPAVFIRAPWIERAGPGVEVLASHDGHAVFVRSGNVMGTAFHPELTRDRRVHEFFIHELVKNQSRAAA